MKRAVVVTVSSLVVAGLASGCMWGRESRRAEAERAAARSEGQRVDVDIDVQRHEHRGVPAQDEVDDERSRERSRAAPGEVAAAMIAPEECPMVEGAEVSLVDLGDGAALEFVAADEGEVQIVRDRVLNIAVKHQRAMQERLTASSPHAAPKGDERGGHAREGSARMKRQARVEADIDPMPPSHVAVVDVDRGARIIFVPVDRSDLDRLNDALEERARYMREGSCPANLMSMQVP